MLRNAPACAISCSLSITSMQSCSAERVEFSSIFIELRGESIRCDAEADHRDKEEYPCNDIVGERFEVRQDVVYGVRGERAIHHEAMVLAEM